MLNKFSILSKKSYLKEKIDGIWTFWKRKGLKSFFCYKRTFTSKKISSFNIIIILNIFFLRNKIDSYNSIYYYYMEYF